MPEQFRQGDTIYRAFFRRGTSHIFAGVQFTEDDRIVLARGPMSNGLLSRDIRYPTTGFYLGYHEGGGHGESPNYQFDDQSKTRLDVVKEDLVVDANLCFAADVEIQGVNLVPYTGTAFDHYYGGVPTMPGTTLCIITTNDNQQKPGAVDPIVEVNLVWNAVFIPQRQVRGNINKHDVIPMQVRQLDGIDPNNPGCIREPGTTKGRRYYVDVISGDVLVAPPPRISD